MNVVLPQLQWGRRARKRTIFMSRGLYFARRQMRVVMLMHAISMPLIFYYFQRFLALKSLGALR